MTVPLRAVRFDLQLGAAVHPFGINHGGADAFSQFEDRWSRYDAWQRLCHRRHGGHPVRAAAVWAL